MSATSAVSTASKPAPVIALTIGHDWRSAWVDLGLLSTIGTSRWARAVAIVRLLRSIWRASSLIREALWMILRGSHMNPPAHRIAWSERDSTVFTDTTATGDLPR